MSSIFYGFRSSYHMWVAVNYHLENKNVYFPFFRKADMTTNWFSHWKQLSMLHCGKCSAVGDAHCEWNRYCILHKHKSKSSMLFPNTVYTQCMCWFVSVDQSSYHNLLGIRYIVSMFGLVIQQESMRLRSQSCFWNSSLKYPSKDVQLKLEPC